MYPTDWGFVDFSSGSGSNPALRGAMTWSTNWDAAAGNAWSSSVGPHVHGLP
ncbi:hypothetical protein [Streptomyces soliscabiei]|uniref:hypothetical protein n=1 Tax=Streptomyces soliscabiei TaxID=588897 RepID=UPI0029A0623F|nr:hypothetical protein [Streptomyces sp. NY05-11A]MDX2675451.1 hypothetical protein [Streptomyces sp. NY05-11A]